jgi:hypothetical protein
MSRDLNGNGDARGGRPVEISSAAPHPRSTAATARLTIHKTRSKETIKGRYSVLYRKSIRAIGLAGALMMICSGVNAADSAKYPEWKGSWERYVPPVSVVSPSGLRTAGGQPSFDQTKPWGRGQQAPLTPEYQKVLEDSIADQARGGQGNNFDRARCMPTGMPHMLTFGPLEFVVTPDTTYILIGTQARRIFTDGRDWPEEIDPSYAGYSIGKWIDEDGDGTYDVLEAETRGFKGPRVYDASGLPLHFDNQSIFKERIYREKADPNILHDVITVIDHALTRPWTVDKRYVHNSSPRPEWRESACVEGTGLVAIGKEMYVLRADGYLMPAKKDQPPPDLRFFKQGAK